MILFLVNVKREYIEHCHRLPSRVGPTPTIVRFHGGKIVHLIHQNKHKLKNLTTLIPDIAGLATDSRICIHVSHPNTRKTCNIVADS